MTYSISEGRAAKYPQILETLQREILSGRYRPGQKLASEAALVRRFGASRGDRTFGRRRGRILPSLEGTLTASVNGAHPGRARWALPHGADHAGNELVVAESMLPRMDGGTHGRKNRKRHTVHTYSSARPAAVASVHACGSADSEEQVAVDDAAVGGQ
jgi:hypothetical protein